MGRFEEFLENRKEQENGFEQEENIKQEINAQKVHEPNRISNIKKYFNEIRKESNLDSGLYNDEYQNDKEENIIENDQIDQGLTDHNFNNQNEGLFIES